MHDAPSVLDTPYLEERDQVLALLTCVLRERIPDYSSLDKILKNGEMKMTGHGLF